MQFSLGNDLSVYTSPVGTLFFFNQVISATLFVLCHFTLLLYRKEFMFSWLARFHFKHTHPHHFSFHLSVTRVCFCVFVDYPHLTAQSLEWLNVNTVSRRCYTLTPATQTHTSKYTHTQVERWWGAKIQHTYSRFMLFIFSFPLFHTHSLTAIVCLLHFFTHTHKYTRAI